MVKDNRDNKDKSWCAWVMYTEKHPHEKVYKMTVGMFFELQRHISKCSNCQESLDRILTNHPRKIDNKYSEN